MRYRRVAPRWASFAFVAIGLYVVLLSLDIIPYVPFGRRRGLLETPHHWQITSFGIGFMAAGVLMGLPRAWGGCRLAFGIPAAVGLLAPFAWMVLAAALPLTDRVVMGIPLVIGLMGAVLAAYQRITGKPFDPGSLDPLEAAQILRRHGRPEQAEAVLRHAMKEEPARREQLQRAIDAMKRRRPTK